MDFSKPNFPLPLPCLTYFCNIAPKGLGSRILESWSLKTGLIAWPETSIGNYQYSLSNSSRERRSHLLRCGSLKSRISGSFLLRMRDGSDKICGENQNTFFLCSIIFPFQKSFRLWEKVEKYGRAGQATDDNIIRRMRFACYKHTLKMCNTYCLSTATIVARICLNITLYVHCQSCLAFLYPVIRGMDNLIFPCPLQSKQDLRT